MRGLGPGLLAFVGLVAIAVPARADVESATRTKAGDNYIFGDELVNSDVSFPSGAVLRVRPPALRTMLIRPRASFVSEMLKSVEKM
jgi:hypothetical protein